ncbi:MAG: hypothetical protein QOG20_6107 [Pseudonocardiales bacterium]|nr:hypothetical protein [Pseudonocardiales bacterium]
MSETVTTRIPVQSAGPPPPPSRWGRLRSRFDSMSPRAKWINLVLIVLLILAIVLAFMVIGNPSTPPVAVRTVAVVRGTVTASVTGSGNTASSLSTAVNFQGGGGMVTAINVKPGDTVTLGEVLATVDPTSAKNTLRTAQAQLASAQASLAQAASGPTAVKAQQDAAAITQAQADVASATTGVSNAQKQLALDTTSTASTVSAAETRFNDDQATTNTAIRSAEATLDSDTVAQNQAVANAKAQCGSMSPLQSATPNTAPSSAPTSTPNTPTGHTMQAYSTPMYSSNCPAAQQAEATRSATLQRDQIAVTAAQQNQSTILDGDQAAITADQQNASSMLLKDNQAITTDKQTLTTDQGSVTNARLAQQADLHPMTPDQIAGFQDSVNEAQVTVDNAQLGVTQTNLLAPQAGVVLQVNGKVNETSSNTTAASSTGTTGTTAGGSSTVSATISGSASGSGFISLANASQLAVNANIPEADAAKIQLGQRATIAFPATNTTATGSVTQITPQGTPTNNVVEFPVQVSLDTAPPGVDVGSTANLTIAAASATDVLEVPNLAVTSLGNRHTVTVRRNGTDTVVPVTTGLVGDTQTEITSGVQPGDMVVLPSTSATSTGSTPATSANTGAGFPRTGG